MLIQLVTIERSDIKIQNVQKFLNYKLITIKTSKNNINLKVTSQIIKNVAFGIAVLEILKLN